MRYLPTSCKAVEKLSLTNNLAVDFYSSALSVRDKASRPQTMVQAMQTLLQPYLACGDRVAAVQHCRAYYAVILLKSGTLLLFAPQIPACNGRVLSPEADPVVDVAAGDFHIVYCTASGAVYSGGYSNRYGQLGDGSIWEPEVEEQCPTPGEAFSNSDGALPPPFVGPRRIPGFGSPAPLGAGKLTEMEGAVDMVEDPSESTPSESYHTASGGDKRDGAALPARVTSIRAVVCGAEHTLLLSAVSNCVYSCGRGHCGQLGIRRTAIPLQPVFRAIPLSLGLPIRQIFAAGHHSFLLLDTGRLLAFGQNQCGQLGLGHTRNVLTLTSVILKPESCARALLPEKGEINSGDPSLSRTRQDAMRKSSYSPLLDAKAYITLRAPYESVEKVYYPLRVPRVDACLDSVELFVVAIWGCATTTILLTKEHEWLSCGLPVTRSWADNQGSTRSEGCLWGGDVARNWRPRCDAYGALGRPLRHFEDGFRFGRMAWTAGLQAAIRQCGGEEGDQAATTIVTGAEACTETHGTLVECVSYPHVTVVKIEYPDQPQQHLVSQDACPSAPPMELLNGTRRVTLFVESSVCEAIYESIAPEKSTRDMCSLLNPEVSSSTATLIAHPLATSPRLLLQLQTENGGEGGNEAVSSTPYVDDKRETPDDAMTISFLATESKLLPFMDYILVM